MALLLIACESGEKKITKQPVPKIPPEPQKEVLKGGYDAIQIRLNDSNEALIEGNIVAPSEIESAIRLAKTNKGDTATVVIHLKGDTQFGVYSQVHESLEVLLQEERDSVAHMRFDKLYDDLSETQRAVIKRKHHLRIIEKMKR